MKRPLLAIIALTLTSFAATEATDDLKPELVSVPLGEIYIPQGFDNNDNALVVTEGYFANSCYQVGPREVSINESERKIFVEQKAYYFRGRPCLMMIVPYVQTVQLGHLPAGEYDIVDATTDTVVGRIPIHDALNEGPDDYLYASIRDAWVRITDFDAIVVLQGELPSNCWELAENRVIVESENVVSVLPIMAQKQNVECSEGPVPFEVEVVIAPKIRIGRHLLHVRSLEGVSINKLFDTWD